MGNIKSEYERDRIIREYLDLAEECVKKANECMKEASFYQRDASMFLNKADTLRGEVPTDAKTSQVRQDV